MIWALEFIAPLIVFVALIDFRRRARRRALRPVQLQGGLREPAHDLAQLESPEPVPHTTPAAEDTHQAFDKLRRAMEDDDANIFALLQAALSDLIRVGRSFEVCMRF